MLEQTFLNVLNSNKALHVEHDDHVVLVVVVAVVVPIWTSFLLPGVRDAFGTPIYNRGARCIWCSENSLQHKQRQRRVDSHNMWMFVSWFLVGRFCSSNTSPIRTWIKWNRPDIYQFYHIHPNSQILAHIHLYIQMRCQMRYHMGSSSFTAAIQPGS